MACILIPVKCTKEKDVSDTTRKSNEDLRILYKEQIKLRNHTVMGHGGGPLGPFSEISLSNLTEQSHFFPVDTLLKLIRGMTE